MKAKLAMMITVIIFTTVSCNNSKKSNSGTENTDIETNTKMDDNTIVEKYWKLKMLEGKAITMVDNQEREIFFTLKGQDNRVIGFAGCNTISGEYTLEDGNRIRFSNMATTMKMCPDVDINESEVLEVFNLTDNYTINADVLSLNVGRRAPLALFEAVYMR